MMMTSLTAFTDSQAIVDESVITAGLSAVVALSQQEALKDQSFVDLSFKYITDTLITYMDAGNAISDEIANAALNVASNYVGRNSTDFVQAYKYLSDVICEARLSQSLPDEAQSLTDT